MNSKFKVGDRVRPRQGSPYRRAYFDMAGENGQATVTRGQGDTLMFVTFDNGYDIKQGYTGGMGVWCDGFELAEPEGPDIIEQMFT